MIATDKSGSMSKPTSAFVLEWGRTFLNQLGEITPGSERITPRSNPSSLSWTLSGAAGAEIVKVFIKHHDEELMFEREVNALSMLASSARPMRDGSFPRLLGKNDNARLIAITWVDGWPVGTILRSAAYRLGSRTALNRGCEASFRVGLWLKGAYEATLAPSAPFPSDEIMARIESLVAYVRNSGTLTASDCGRILEWSCRLQRSLKPTYCTSLAHCDFWFDHILCTAHGDVAVVDFGRARTNPRGRDAVEFVLRLQDLSVGNPLLSKKRVTQLAAAFFRGHGEIDLSEAGMQLLAIMRRLEQLGGFIEDQPKGLRQRLELYQGTTTVSRWLRSAAKNHSGNIGDSGVP